MRLRIQSLRRVILLVSFCLLSVLSFSQVQAQAQRPGFRLEDRTYLYYFESDDALLTDISTIKGYSFGTLDRENVTLLVYGLDDLVTPRLTLYDQDGNPLMQGVSPFNQNITLIEFQAAENRLYHFDVERAAGAGGIARVMLFEGEPLDYDVTILDNINPLLLGRAFLVADKHRSQPAAAGLGVEVQVLDVTRFDTRPEVFASRGTNDSSPSIEDRFKADDLFRWLNTAGHEFYTINVRARPEPLNPAAQTVDYRALNLNTFFYFDYYLTIGAGSEPVALVRGDDCQSQPDRIECIRTSGNSTGRTAPVNIPPPPETPVVILPVTFPDTIAVVPAGPPPAPAVTTCAGGVGTVGETFIGTALNDIHGGTTCDDTLFGLGGADNLNGGPGNDVIDGGPGNDPALRGGDNADRIYGGAGNDFLFGENGTDTLWGGAGNDVLDGGAGSDFVAYDDSLSPAYTVPNGVTVNLSTACGGVPVPPTPVGTGCTSNDGEGIGSFDRLLNIENIIGSIHNDSLTGNTGDNIILGRAGDDNINGNGGSDTLDGQAGDDVFTFDSPVGGTTTVNGSDFGVADNDTYIFESGAQGDFFVQDRDGSPGDLIDFDDLPAGVIFSLSSASAQNIAPGLNITLNPFNDITRLNGTDFDDQLTGSNTAQLCIFIFCFPIANLIPNDTITAGDGNDIVFGSQGNDTLDGGNNTAAGDTAAYNNSNQSFWTGGVGVNLGGAPVTVNGVNIPASSTVKLEPGNVVVGTDTLNNIENATGSNFNDILVGSGAANTLNGAGGNDFFLPGGGNDTIDGGSNGFAGDTLDYSGNATSISVALNGTSGTVTGSGTDNFTSIENFIGSNLNDSFVINSARAGAAPVVGDTNASSVVHTTINSEPIGTDNLTDTSSNFFDFGATGSLTGNLVLVNNLADTLDTSSFNLPFNPSLAGVWQEVVAGQLFIYLTNASTVFCSSGAPLDIIYSGGNDDAAVMNDTRCNTNDQFDGSGGTDTINYNDATLGSAVNLTVNVGNTSLNVRDNGAVIGSDTVLNTENILLGTGTNNISFAGYTAGAVTYDLTNGVVTGGVIPDIAGGQFTSVEASMQADVITGNALDNNFYALSDGDADTFTGGTQVTADTLRYADANNFTTAAGLAANTAFTVNIQAGNDTVVSAGTDTISGFEVLVAGTAADTFNLTENGTASGYSLLDAGDGDDTFVGTPLSGGTWTQLDGSTGTADTLSFAAIGAALTETINGGTITAQQAGTTTTYNITNIEQILGSNTAVDTVSISNSAGISLVSTGGGNDTVNLLAAYTPTATTTLEGGANAAGSDTINMSALGTAVTVNVTSPTAATIVGGNPLLNFEAFVGSSVNDTFDITYDNTTQTFDGSAGGNDTIIYNRTGTGITVAIAAATTVTGSNDTVTNFENFTGTTNNDTFNISNATSYTGTTGVFGNDGNDTFTVTALDAANNLYDGGNNTDTITYNMATPLTVTVTSATNTTVRDTAATQGIDTLANFETLVTGSGNDTWVVSGANPLFTATFNAQGQTTADTIDYTAFLAALTFDFTGANPTVTDGTGTNTLINFETIIGGSGTNTWTFNNTAGRTINGGTGTNTVLYTSQAYMLNIGASVSVNDAGPGAADTLSNIQTITTSGNFVDTVNVTACPAAAPAINTGDGNDTWNLSVVAGRSYDGGSGTDTASYTTATADLIVNLVPAVWTVTGDCPPGTTSTDNLSNFENFSGTGSGNDSWTVSNVSATTYNAGTGTDAITYTTNTGAVTLNGASFGGDTLTGFETLTLNNTVNDVTMTGTSTITTLSLMDGDDSLTTNFDTTANTFDGGAGSDDITYGNTPLTITWVSATQASAVNGGTTDLLNNFENFTTGSGADTYNWADDNITHTLTAGTGSDTLDYSLLQTTGLTFNLGATSTVVGAATDTISGFQVLRGGTGDDIFNVTSVAASNFTTIDSNNGNDTFNVSANSGANALLSGGNNDDTFNVLPDAEVNTFNGGANNDTVSYAGYAGPGPLNYTLNNVALTITGLGTDTLTAVETITLTGFSDNVQVGNTAAPTAATTLNTGSGSDTVTVTDAGTLTTVDMGTGSDTVTYNAPADGTDTVFEGGANNDTYTYNAGGSGLNYTANLTGTSDTITDSGGTADIDTFSNFETGNITTGSGNDTFTIDITDPTTYTLAAGTGINRFIFTGNTGAAAATTITLGGTGTETLDFSALTGGGVTIDLTAASQTIGAFTLTITGTIETVIGTNQADTITGDNNANTIYAGGGNDTVSGGGGNDNVYGGTGTDTVSGGGGNDNVYGGNLCGVTAAAGTADAGNDVVDGGAGSDNVYGGNNNNTVVSAGNPVAATAGNCDDTGSDSVTDPTGGDTDKLFGGNNNLNGGTGTDTDTDTVNATDADATVDTAAGDNQAAAASTNTETPAVTGDASDTTSSGDGT